MSSEIKADKWSPASGTSATIGDSGDTYTVPSGVTLDIASGATLDATGATVTGITSTTINNNADNRVITGSGTANTLEGESTLTYGSSNLGVGIATPTFTNGNGLHLNSVSDNLRLHLTNTATGTASGDGTDIAVGSDGALNIINKENAITRLYTNDTERMRIAGDGEVSINDGHIDIGTVTALKVKGGAGAPTCILTHKATSGEEAIFHFRDGANETCGTVTINAANNTTAYNTSSDYRLKENQETLSNGITRLKELKPYRFNWKSNSSGDKVDGFFAHEVSSVIPEAIYGVKDAVDSDNNPIHQGIDQSKLVPLLTKALQEAITKIETLETENTDIKARLTALENA